MGFRRDVVGVGVICGFVLFASGCVVSGYILFGVFGD